MKSKLILLIMLISVGVSAQYNRFSIGTEIGVNAVGDQSAVVESTSSHYGLTARYNFNPITSLGVSTGWDNLTLESIEGESVKANYGRISLELYIDIFDILQLQNDVFTVLVHGGGGFSRISTDNSYQDTMFNATGGAMGLFKLSRSVSLTAGFRNTANITQDMTIDGTLPIANASVNSTVTNFTAGLIFNVRTGEKGVKQQHADWVK